LRPLIAYVLGTMYRIVGRLAQDAAQRRHDDPEDVDPRVEVLAELAAARHRRQVGMGARAFLP
jgi:hypothetical protein